VEEAVINLAPLALAGTLCLFGNQLGIAQQAACGGEDACIADQSPPKGTRPHQSSALTEMASLAVQERCPEAPVDVTAASPDERRLACSAAYDAIRLLGRCNISLRKPLRLEIVSEVRHPFSGPIFGLFDTKQERVLVTQEANIPALMEGTPYATLPRRDFYRSLIVHEVVHGVMHQNLKRPATSHAAYEYPAYALQLASLPSNVRDRFLESFDQRAINADSIFNDSILFFDPYFFAARAYRHFKASANGCTRLTALLDGEVAFIAPPM
jgi:hypothetical protein